jgi:ATP-binding cassette subfamily F protein 3
VAAINFKFKFDQKSGRHIIKLHEISKSYGPVEILQNTSAHIERGDKIALIGANGKGKSTLLRIIAGTESIKGEREEGYNVIEGFYAQHQLEDLGVNNEILEELKQAGSNKTELELRQILGCFLFSDDDVFKKIKVLSGGEKSRVALAKTLISNANFLLLDEPTNHLDFISENILIQALQQYQGSFIVVSHNRHFISQVANKIWYIQDKEIKEYPGTYEEYNYWASQQEEQAGSQTEIAPKKPKTKRVRQRDENAKEITRLESSLYEIEDKITEMENVLRTQEEQLSSPDIYGNPDKLTEVTMEYEKSKDSLQELHKSWEEVASQIDALS